MGSSPLALVFSRGLAQFIGEELRVFFIGVGYLWCLVVIFMVKNVLREDSLVLN